MDVNTELFYLEENEIFEKMCGEILLTNRSRMAINCTLCDIKYKDFEEYVKHVYMNHMATVDDLDEKPDIAETEISDSLLADCDTEDDSHTNVKIEIECLDDEALKEEELLLSMLKPSKKKDKLITQSTLPPPTLKNSNVKDKIPDEELVIPAVIRDIKKLTYWGTKVPSDEERKHKCPICGVAFKERRNLRRHFKRHSDERDHECPDCGKKFYTPSEVKVHRRFHTNDNEYLCSDCGRSFKSHSQLTNHIKRHKNQRDFKCKVCNKAYFDSLTLKNHMASHSKEKPFTCQICAKGFKRPIALTTHMKLHENKRAYKCSICGVGFNQQAGLFSHMKVTHKTT